MSSFLGSDTDALRDLSRLYEANALTLAHTSAASLDRALAVAWIGPDADEFRATCLQVRYWITEVQEAIQGRADRLLEQAEQQDNASSAEEATQGSGPGRQDETRTGMDRAPKDSGGDGAWGMPDFFPDISPHEWIPPLLKEGADAIADHAEKGLPVAERAVKKLTPLIPDAYDAGRHYLNGETAEGNFAVMRGAVSVIPFVGLGVDLADIATSADPEGSLLDRAEEWYVDGMNDPNSAMSEGEREGLRKADEYGIENKYARNIFKSIMGNGRAWEENNLHRDEDGKINPWMT